ncbi:hypothetical protein Tco_1290522, partial [Tanacetum coccineum]
SGRVRVVVRLRHKNTDALISDYFNCVELQPENMDRNGKPVGECCTKDGRLRESRNPSVLNEEECLPSPSLDDLAFLNPHSMSLDLFDVIFLFFMFLNFASKNLLDGYGSDLNWYT